MIDMGRINTARQAILDDLRDRAARKDPNVRASDPRDAHRWHGKQPHFWCGAGEMDCPVCKAGRLRYSRAGYNGHIHARCSTPSCVAWME